MLLLLPGFLRPTFGHYVDWWNHTWIVSYFSEYFSQNHSFPLTFNTNNRGGIGNPFPIFYGHLLYPMIGILGSLLGGHTALRIFIIATYFLQFYVIKKVFEKIYPSSILPWVVATLSVWTIYPLTNLYNRSAITEFLAISFYTISLCYFFLTLWSTTVRQQFSNGIFMVYFLTLCIGTHTITALYGLTFLAPVAIVSYIQWRQTIVSHRYLLLILLGQAPLLILAVSPWLYALYLFLSDLPLTLNLPEPMVRIFPESIDSLACRFFPLPLDLRSLGSDLYAVSTPYLDAQINIPLLLLFLWLAYHLFSFQRFSYRMRQPKNYLLIVTSISLFIVTTILSVSLLPYSMLPKIFGSVQFSYRLVSFINLSLLLMVMAILHVKNRMKPFSRSPLAVTVILTMAFFAVLVKLTHAYAVVGHKLPDNPLRSDRYSINMTEHFYGIYDYTASRYREVPTHEFNRINFTVREYPDFGSRTDSIDLNLSESRWILSNVHAFPWNKVSINQVDMPPESIRKYRHMVAFELTPGDYQLSYGFKPPPLFRLLRTLSLVLVMVIWPLAGLFLLSPLHTGQKFP